MSSYTSHLHHPNHTNTPIRSTRPRPRRPVRRSSSRKWTPSAQRPRLPASGDRSVSPPSETPSPARTRSLPTTLRWSSESLLSVFCWVWGFRVRTNACACGCCRGEQGTKPPSRGRPNEWFPRGCYRRAADACVSYGWDGLVDTYITRVWSTLSHGMCFEAVQFRMPRGVEKFNDLKNMRLPLCLVSSVML